MRALIILAILSLHAAFIALNASLPDVIGAFVAGTVYLPLWPLVFLGAPVLESAPAGGWASPSLAGWTVLLLVWATFWWTLVGVTARLWKRMQRQGSGA